VFFVFPFSGFLAFFFGIVFTRLSLARFFRPSFCCLFASHPPCTLFTFFSLIFCLHPFCFPVPLFPFLPPLTSSPCPCKDGGELLFPEVSFRVSFFCFPPLPIFFGPFPLFPPPVPPLIRLRRLPLLAHLDNVTAPLGLGGPFCFFLDFRAFRCQVPVGVL